MGWALCSDWLDVVRRLLDDAVETKTHIITIILYYIDVHGTLRYHTIIYRIRGYNRCTRVILIIFEKPRVCGYQPPARDTLSILAKFYSIGTMYLNSRTFLRYDYYIVIYNPRIYYMGSYSKKEDTIL